MSSDYELVTSKLRLAVFVSVGLLVISLIQIWGLGVLLPQEVPIHFDWNGDPDRFTSRAGFLWSMTGLVIGTTAFLLFFGWLTPKIPDSMINLPNKEYWLAPERRETSHRRIQLMLVWVGSLTTLLFSAIAFLSWLVGMQYLANISPWVWIVVAVYTVAIMYMCLGGFSKPADSIETNRTTVS